MARRHALRLVKDDAGADIHVEHADGKIALVQEADPDRYTPERALAHDKIGRVD